MQRRLEPAPAEPTWGSSGPGLSLHPSLNQPTHIVVEWTGERNPGLKSHLGHDLDPESHSDQESGSEPTAGDEDAAVEAGTTPARAGQLMPPNTERPEDRLYSAALPSLRPGPGLPRLLSVCPFGRPSITL